MSSCEFNSSWLNFATDFSICSLKKAELVNMCEVFNESLKYTLVNVVTFTSSCLKIKVSNLSLL